MFETLVFAMETYFGSLFEDLGTILLNQEHNMVVLLCDEHLLKLPLEAMKIFHAPGIKSLSRDFSFQMFYYRYKQRDLGNIVSYNFLFDLEIDFNISTDDLQLYLTLLLSCLKMVRHTLKILLPARFLRRVSPFWDIMH